MSLSAIKRHTRWVPGIVIAAGITGITGCQHDNELTKSHKAKSAAEVGYVFVAPLPPIPWSKVSAQLQPKHNITAEQARNMAATATKAELAQFLSTFAAGLNINLPTIAKSVTDVAGPDGSSRTTSRVRSTGAVPGSPGTPSADIGDDALQTDFSKGLGTGGIDGGTLLTAGTAIYQQAKILDNQIANAYAPEGYQAHLVTLQVNLQPLHRNAAYDAYTRVSLFPADWKTALAGSNEVGKQTDALPPVIVFPMVVTENLETTNVSRSLEKIRKAALQLSGSLGAVGVGAGVSGGNNRLEQIVGSDRNSLLTLGRINDNTLQIRIGAFNSGSAGFAMVPRSFNVSLLVMTRWHTEDDKKKGNIKTLAVTTHTEFVSSEDGAKLPSGTNVPALASTIKNNVFWYGFSPDRTGFKPTPNTKKKCTPSPKSAPKNATETQKKKIAKDNAKKEQDFYLGLHRAVSRGDYEFVKDCFVGSEPLTVQRQIELRRLLAKLSEMNVGSRYSDFLIALPDGPSQPKLPDDKQLVLYSDDGKKATSFALYGGAGLKPADIQAYLCLTKPSGNDCAKKLLPIGPAVLADGGSKILLSFPSLAATKLAIADEKGTPLTLAASSDPSKGSHYKIHAYTKAQTQKASTKSPVSSTHDKLVADTGGTAKVVLHVGKFPGAVKAIRLVVSGAHPVAVAPPSHAQITNDGVIVTKPTALTLTLGNLIQAGTVSVASYDGKTKLAGDLKFVVFRSDAPDG